MAKRIRASDKLRKEIVCNQNGLCNRCCTRLSRLFDIDHIIPFSISFDNSGGNLQALCLQCHGAKTRYEDRAFFSSLQKVQAILPSATVCYTCYQITSLYFSLPGHCNNCRIDRELARQTKLLSIHHNRNSKHA